MVVDGGLEWGVFIALEPKGVWSTVKVCCLGRAERKANYWLGWNGSRWATGADAVHMLEGRPELAVLVKGALAMYACDGLA